MMDVYNRSVAERNSIQEIPEGYISDASNSMLRFMGSFWRNIHEGRGMVNGLQEVRGVKVAQLYLDLLESLKLHDRNGLPVFHRELWKPLVIRLSQRNRAQENILKVGDGISLGEQPEGSKYGDGTELNIGSLASLEGYVTYPVDGGIQDIVSGITNNVIRPTVAYEVSGEFPSDGVSYVNGTLIFPKDKDPFLPDSGFETYDVVDDVRDSASHDVETVLWASDVLIDKDYLSDHMAYALGVTCKSDYVAKRILNARWDALNCSLTPELFRELLAAILNVPVIQSETETVTGIATGEDGRTRVATDKGLYTINKGARLRDCVEIGAVLHRGDLLDQGIKIYPLITDPSEEKLENTTEYFDILKSDVPVISVPRTILRTKTSNGLAVDWLPTDVMWKNGDYDKNGHRKLFFSINGPEADVARFWEDVWSRAEEENVDLDEIFQECEYYEDEDESTESSGSSPSGSWQVVPAAFFLKHMIGGNTIIVTVDRSQIEDMSKIHDKMYFDMVNESIPSGMRLFMIEHVDVGDGHDEFTMEPPEGGEYAMGADDEVEKFVAVEPEDEFDEYSYNSLPGIKGKKMPTYEDEVELKFFRNRKRNTE